MQILSLPVTTAQSAQVSASTFFPAGPPQNLIVQANFVYGSGGTSVSAWLQTTLDGGSTWCDVANFSFTTASSRQVVNLSGLTVIGSPIAPTDGTMSANAGLGGLVGPQWRVKYTTVGTYAGGTSLAINMHGIGAAGAVAPRAIA